MIGPIVNLPISPRYRLSALLGLVLGDAWPDKHPECRGLRINLIIAGTLVYCFHNSANGITNKSIKMAFLLATMMFVTLVVSREMTEFQPGQGTTLRLNFFIMSCCWVLFSSGWIFWSDESRTFTYRKFCKIKSWALNQKSNEKKAYEQNNQNKTNICRECDVGTSCTNCIAKEVIRRKPLAIETQSSDLMPTPLPGSVLI